MRKLILSLMAMTSMASAAQERICINGEWLFRYACDTRQADSIYGTGFYKPDYDAAGFRPVRVPSCWAVQGYEEPVYREFKTSPHSEGFYIRRFAVPQSFGGRRILLHFGGVWASAEVWVNGEWTGRHDSGYTSFAYDVTGKLKAGKENTIAVRVRQVYPYYRCDTFDDWSLGGIYRDVTLESMPPKRWIDDVRIVTDFDDNYRDADLRVKVMVSDRHKNTLPGNYVSPGNPYVLRLTLTDADGNVVARKDRNVKSHTATGRETTETIHVDTPRQWNAESPYLYDLRVDLVENGTVAQTYSHKVGFREISTKGGVFRINGKAVKLRGVNHHDEYPDAGRATTREHWLRDLQMMKAGNVNYVRAAHYQHAKGFIEMCDSIGMYVGGEVSLGGAGDMMDDPGFTAGVMLRTVETVKRDLNNASIVYWSVGNEDPFTTAHLDAVKTVKALDGTRPVLLPWNADDTLPEEIDILAPHYWSAAEYDSLCSGSSRPVISTEYTHAYGESRFGSLDRRWKAISARPTGAGAAVWMWADQGIHTPTLRDEKIYGSIVKDDKHLRINSNGWDGVVSSYRKPTRDYAELKAVYSPVRIATDSITMKPGEKSIFVPIVNNYDFTRLDAVNMRWALYKDGRQLAAGTGKADAAPHSTGSLSVPVSKLGTLKEGETAYIIIAFTGADGSEITRECVELVDGRTRADSRKASGKAPTVTDNGKTVTVKAGKAEYVFNRTTGTLESMKKGNKPVVGNIRPSVWHKLNDGDMTIKNRKFAKGVSLEKLAASVRSFKAESTPEGVIVTSVADYAANDSNRLAAHFVYHIYNDGKMTLDYTLDTDFQTSYLPLAGVQATLPSADALKQWFGLGPDDSHFNKRSASVLGLWDGKLSFGTKLIRWAETGNGAGASRISAPCHLVRDTESPSVVRFATRVLGRCEKGRLKEPGEPLPSKGTYTGTLTIE